MEPRLVVVGIAEMVRLLSGQKVVVEACNVTMVPTADLPELVKIGRIMSQLATKKKRPPRKQT